MATLGVVLRLCCRLTSPFRRLCCLGITPPLYRVRPPRSTQSNVDFHSNPSNPAVLGNDLIREILKWLPVKSLMRFKCVSKEWLSILSDPSFARDYSGGFRGPIVVGPNGSRSRSRYPYTMIHYLSIDDIVAAPTCEAYHHSTVDHGGEELAYTSVVNGLVCFYKDDKAWLYNIATRERVQIPVSGHLPTENAFYQLGFDPVTKLYKLLRRTCGNCEILTIGVDSSWRFIPSLPPHVFSRDCLCLDGLIYGIEFEYTGRCYLSAFHVADEVSMVLVGPRFFL